MSNEIKKSKITHNDKSFNEQNHNNKSYNENSFNTTNNNYYFNSESHYKEEIKKYESVDRIGIYKV